MVPSDLSSNPHKGMRPAGTIVSEDAASSVVREDRRRRRRRAPLHPLMETFIDVMAQGRPHLREKASRLSPLVEWCRTQGIDPVRATVAELTRFRAWLWDAWRTGEGAAPAYNTKRQVLGLVRCWYRWLPQGGHRTDDPSMGVLVVTPGAPRPSARFIHHPLHPRMEAFVEVQRLRGREGTARTADLTLRQFAAWCDAHGLSPLRLRRDDADAYLVHLTTEARTPRGELLKRTTVDMRIAYVKAFYEWLEVHREIIANPAAKLRVRVVKSRVVLHEHLTLQEATALVQTQAATVVGSPAGSVSRARRLRLLAAVCLCLATGRRISGLLGIRVEHLDQERRELRVEREKGRTGRVLPVAEWALTVVQEYLTQARPLLACSPPVPWLFVDGTGAQRSTRNAMATAIEDLVRRTVEANPDLGNLGAKRITWHSLRVSFATLLFANGCPIRSVNELMLHQCLSTTARYTPIPIEDMQQLWRTVHPRP